MLHDNFAEYRILGCNLFTSLNVFSIFFLGCQVSAEKSAYSLQGNPLYVIICFPFAAFKIFYLSFAVLVMIYLGMCLFIYLLIGTLCFLNLGYCILLKLEKFSSIILSVYFLLLSVSSPSGNTISQLLVWLMLTQSPLKLFLFLLFFSFCSSDCPISTNLSSNSFMCSSVLLNLLLILSSVFSIAVIIFVSSD